MISQCLHKAGDDRLEIMSRADILPMANHLLGGCWEIPRENTCRYPLKGETSSFWLNFHRWLHWKLSDDNFQCSGWLNLVKMIAFLFQCHRSPAIESIDLKLTLKSNLTKFHFASKLFLVAQPFEIYLEHGNDTAVIHAKLRMIRQLKSGSWINEVLYDLSKR